MITFAFYCNMQLGDFTLTHCSKMANINRKRPSGGPDSFCPIISVYVCRHTPSLSYPSLCMHLFTSHNALCFKIEYMVYCFFEMNVVEKLWITNNAINDHVMEM